MNIVCLRKNVETSATLPAHLPRLISPSCSQPSMRSKQLLLRGSTIKESVLGNGFFFKEVAMQAPETKKGKQSFGGFRANTLQECLWFSSAPARSSLCVPPGSLQPLLCQPTQRRNAKIARTHPGVQGSPALHTQAHSFQLLDDRQRDRHMKRVCKPRPDGPL